MTQERFFEKCILVALLCCPGVLFGQSYPSKTVTLVVPFVQGGQHDTSARIVSEPLSKLLGQPVVVENRAGASGNIAYQMVARAPKDGYTILVGYIGTSACNPSLFANLTWDPIKDFAAVAMLTTSTHVIVVHPSVPAHNLKELIAYLKQNPGKVNLASSGLGTLSHIGPVRFQQLTQTEMVHVPFKGGGQVMPELLAGRIQVYFATPASAMQHVQAGKLRALAVTSMSRNPSMRDVPTANESGLPAFEVEAWAALFAPAGTPSEVITKLSDAVKRALEMPATRQRVAGVGLETSYLGPEAMAAQVQKDLDTCSATIRAAGIKAD